MQQYYRGKIMPTDTYDVNIETLSPIHIGAGKSYSPSEFVLSKAKQNNRIVETIKRVDLSKFYLSLEDDKKDELIDGLSNSDFSLSDFESKIKKEFTRYLSYDSTNTQDKNIKINEIQEHIKTSDKLYIPGSSIKGAIETAILYDLIDYDDIDKISTKLISRNRIDKREYKNMIQSYFSAERGNTAQTSIFRFLQISDTTTIKIPRIYQSWTVMATPNSGNEFYSRNNKRVRTYLETIPANKKLKSRFVTNYDSKFYRSLRIDDKNDIVDIDYIKNTIYNFSQDLIDYELKYSDDYHISYLSKFYKELSKKNTEDSPLLRVGSGSGLMGTSIAMKVNDMDYRSFEAIKSTFKRKYPWEFPKSRKITSTGKPFGWIKLNFK
jgi:CRISPR-associated protein Csm5